MARRMTGPMPGTRATRDPYFRDCEQDRLVLPDCSGGRDDAEDIDDKVDEAGDNRNGGSSAGGTSSSNRAAAVVAATAAASELGSGGGLTPPLSGHGDVTPPLPPPPPSGHATTVVAIQSPPQSGHATTVAMQPPQEPLRPKQPMIPPPTKLLLMRHPHNNI